MSTYPGLPIPTDPDGVDHPIGPLSVSILRGLGARRFHTFNEWWAITPQSWACPACRRGKRLIAHLVGSDAHAALQDHHDHAADVGATAAFDRAIICTACNFADGGAKRMVKAILSAVERVTFWKGFSFSPNDIGKFVVLRPNAKGYRLDREAVFAAWQEREPDFRWRLDHSGSELPSELRPPPLVQGTGTQELLRAADAALSSMVDPRTGMVLTSSAWRYEAIVAPNGRRSERRLRPPTEEEIDWAVADRPQRIAQDWICPCCTRPLRDTVIRNGPKPPFLSIARHRVQGAFETQDIDLCHSCGLLLAQIGQQAGRVAGLRRSAFSLGDIRRFTTTERNVHHPGVDPAEMDAMVLRVAAAHRG